MLLCAGVLQGCADLRLGAPASGQASGPELATRTTTAPEAVTQDAANRRGAAQAPPAAPIPARQELQGQLSIKLQALGKTPAKGLSLGFFFSGGTDSGQLDLITLMGSQLAQVNWAPGEVWLTDDKGRHHYESMEHLSQAVLGEALPLGALVHWMQGHPDPAWPSAPNPKARGFVQLGWTIDQSELDSKKLTATRAGTSSQRGVFLKVYLDR